MTEEEGFTEDEDEALEDAEASEDESTELRMYPAQFYDMRVPKGNIGDLLVMYWDKVRECGGEKCSLFSQCPYYQDKSKIKRMRRLMEEGKSLGQCRVEQKFLHYNLKPFLKLLQKVPDDFLMQSIGMHIMPMYHDLVQLLMEKATLKSVTYRDSKGVRRTHPVYDQLLKTHKEILNALKASGLQAVAKEVGFLKPRENFQPKADDWLSGDPKDYEDMSSGVK